VGIRLDPFFSVGYRFRQSPCHHKSQPFLHSPRYLHWEVKCPGAGGNQLGRAFFRRRNHNPIRQIDFLFSSHLIGTRFLHPIIHTFFALPDHLSNHPSDPGHLVRCVVFTTSFSCYSLALGSTISVLLSLSYCRASITRRFRTPLYPLPSIFQMARALESHKKTSFSLSIIIFPILHPPQKGTRLPSTPFLLHHLLRAPFPIRLWYPVSLPRAQGPRSRRTRTRLTLKHPCHPAIITRRRD